MTEIHEIIDEGFFDSTMDQMLKHFGEEGTTAVYVRAADRKHHPETMLASTEPITDEAYEHWLREKEKEEEEVE